jgi:hypothetical protein
MRKIFQALLPCWPPFFMFGLLLIRNLRLNQDVLFEEAATVVHITRQLPHQHQQRIPLFLVIILSQQLQLLSQQPILLPRQ